MEGMLQVRIAELAACFVLLIGILHGYGTGLVKTLYQMVRLILATIVSVILAPMIVAFIPETVVARHGVAYLVALIAAMILLAIVNRILGIVDHIPGIKTVNKVAGATAGAVFGLVILWVLMIMAGTFRDLEWCNFVVKMVQKSSLLSWLHGINPIPDILHKLNFPII